MLGSVAIWLKLASSVAVDDTSLHAVFDIKIRVRVNHTAYEANSTW